MNTKCINSQADLYRVRETCSVCKHKWVSLTEQQHSEQMTVLLRYTSLRKVTWP